MATSYQRLDGQAVAETVARLQSRISARFPDRNLQYVAGDLANAVRTLLLEPQPRWYGAVRTASRAALGLVALVLVVGTTVLVEQTAASQSPQTVWDWAQIAESTINDVVFAGIAMFFLWQLPDRVQRSHDLAQLHRLRSLAHVIDMHQLTKDPDRLRADFRATERSVSLGLDAAELGHYLDYCSEMLSLVSKTAALYAEHSTDPTVLNTVEGLENMTTGMSRKIWQKIALLPGYRNRTAD